MTKYFRSMALAATVAAFALTATQASAAPVGAATPAVAKATIVKPLTLTRANDLDFGSIVVQDDGTAAMDTSGNITCPASLTCAATGTPAEYNVTGVNNQTVTVTTPAATLTNTLNPGTPLTLTLTGPSSVALSATGTANFKLGGSLPILSSTKDGLYKGDLQVTVNY